jgi:NADH-quinone oxidoreductase subunit H
MTCVYFGGYNFPGMHLIESQNLLATLQIVTIFAKISLFIFAFMWIRWTLPRFRYDQLMHLGWKSMIPLAIVNMLLTGGGILLFGK